MSRRAHRESSERLDDFVETPRRHAETPRRYPDDAPTWPYGGSSRHESSVVALARPLGAVERADAMDVDGDDLEPRESAAEDLDPTVESFCRVRKLPQSFHVVVWRDGDEVKVRLTSRTATEGLRCVITATGVDEDLLSVLLPVPSLDDSA